MTVKINTSNLTNIKAGTGNLYKVMVGTSQVLPPPPAYVSFRDDFSTNTAADYSVIYGAAVNISGGMLQAPTGNNQYVRTAQQFLTDDQIIRIQLGQDDTTNGRFTSVTGRCRADGDAWVNANCTNGDIWLRRRSFGGVESDIASSSAPGTGNLNAGGWIELVCVGDWYYVTWETAYTSGTTGVRVTYISHNHTGGLVEYGVNNRYPGLKIDLFDIDTFEGADLAGVVAASGANKSVTQTVNASTGWVQVTGFTARTGFPLNGYSGNTIICNNAGTVNISMYIALSTSRSYQARMLNNGVAVATFGTGSGNRWLNSGNVTVAAGDVITIEVNNQEVSNSMIIATTSFFRVDPVFG